MISHTRVKKMIGTQPYVCFSILVFLFVIAMPKHTEAFGSWNQETTARELCFLYALSKDWQQTRDISKNPDKFSESNPFLGPHPSTGKVDRYFATCAATHALVAYMLPPRYSKLWQVTWIGIQSNVTEHNTDNGLDQNMNMEYMITFSIPF